MTSKILKSNGQVIHTQTCRPSPTMKGNLPEEIRARNIFDELIRKRLGEPLTEKDLQAIDPDAVTPEHDRYEDDEQKATQIPDADDVTPEDMDHYVGAEVMLPHMGVQRTGTVRKRARDSEGRPTGKAHVKAYVGHKVLHC
jgi:hypothetical protein